ncbi:SMR family transporter [Bacillus sp. FSL M8-0256]|uniref:DMT family transporter n=1 Tax=Bacillus sp. FSL M8-0256 TaxID=2954578 RepID=UPI0030F81C2A
MTYYILLLLSILLEVIGVFCLNDSDGFTNFVPTILAILFYCSSIAIYISLTAHREVGTVNAVFAGTGTVLVTIIGIIFFNEAISTLKLIGISLIIIGSISINLRFENSRNMCKES